MISIVGQAGIRIPAAAQLFLNTSNFFFYSKFLRFGLGLRWGSGNNSTTTQTRKGTAFQIFQNISSILFFFIILITLCNSTRSNEDLVKI